MLSRLPQCCGSNKMHEQLHFNAFILASKFFMQHRAHTLLSKTSICLDLASDMLLWLYVSSCFQGTRKYLFWQSSMRFCCGSVGQIFVLHFLIRHVLHTLIHVQKTFWTTAQWRNRLQSKARCLRTVAHDELEGLFHS